MERQKAQKRQNLFSLKTKAKIISKRKVH